MDESGLRELLEVWSQRLGLDRWRVTLEIGGVDDEDAYMETRRSAFYERARIYVQPWFVGAGAVVGDTMLKPETLTDDFVESSLVHELLHLHLRDMRAIVRDDLDGQVHRDVYTAFEKAMCRAEEQAVDRLAEALVRAFNG